MRRGLRYAALAAVLAATPVAAGAQLCAGVPLETQRLAAGVLGGAVHHAIGEGVDATEVGVALQARAVGQLAVSLELALRSPEGGALEISVMRAGVRQPLLRPGGAEVCALVGVGLARTDGAGEGTSYTSLTLPLGLALGVPLQLGEARLVPFVAPQLVLASVGGEVLGGDVEAEGYSAALEAGAGLRLGRVVASARLMLSELDAALGTPAFPNRGVLLSVGWTF